MAEERPDTPVIGRFPLFEDAEFAFRACNAHHALVKALEDNLRLVEDMMRFVGQMALKDYALLNDAPIAARRAIQLAHGKRA